MLNLVVCKVTARLYKVHTVHNYVSGRLPYYQLHDKVTVAHAYQREARV
jgi:hypothetical protein